MMVNELDEYLALYPEKAPIFDQTGQREDFELVMIGPEGQAFLTWGIVRGYFEKWAVEKLVQQITARVRAREAMGLVRKMPDSEVDLEFEDQLALYLLEHPEDEHYIRRDEEHGALIGAEMLARFMVWRVQNGHGAGQKTYEILQAMRQQGIIRAGEGEDV